MSMMSTNGSSFHCSCYHFGLSFCCCTRCINTRGSNECTRDHKSVNHVLWEGNPYVHIKVSIRGNTTQGKTSLMDASLESTQTDPFPLLT